jgi:hypothetical protein
MTYYIKEKQLKANLKKYGITSYDKDVVEHVNKLHHQVVTDLLQQRQKQQQTIQKGGRVSFPIDYFGGTTNNLSAQVPPFTNVSGNDVSIRQEMLLNDPSQVLGTDKAMTSGMIGGSSKKYQVSQSAQSDIVKSLSRKEKIDLNDKQRFVQVSKQKFETVIDEVLNKAKKQISQGHLSKDSLSKVLEQKKYKTFKAVNTLKA